MDVSQMKSGDHAGLVALQNHFGTVGIQVAANGNRYVAMCVNGGGGGEETVERLQYEDSLIYLKVHFNFENSVDIASFYYSANGEEWNQIGSSLKMKYTLDHFMGYRIGLFNYASKHVGGHADFDFFRFTKVGNNV
jgi:beta-xylosidase